MSKRDYLITRTTVALSLPVMLLGYVLGAIVGALACGFRSGRHTTEL